MTKLMIDSASDLSKKEADELGILFMPIEVRFGDDEFLDGINLDPKLFFEKLEKANELPKTSLINSYRWEEAFRKATADGSDVVVISISSGLSGGYQSAAEAAKKFDGKVFVVDSLSATIGERLLLLYALKLKDKGLTGKEIAAMLNAAKFKLNIVAMVDSLKYLKMGGRISATSAIVGQMLSIKPLISVIDGKVKNIGKAIGTKKAFVQIKSTISQKNIDKDMPFGLVWSGSSKEQVNNFKKDAAIILNEEEKNINAYAIGSTIGTHVGPGAVGIAFFEK